MTRRQLRAWMVGRRVLVQLGGSALCGLASAATGAVMRPYPLVVTVVALLVPGLLCILFLDWAFPWLDRLDARDRERWRAARPDPEG